MKKKDAVRCVLLELAEKRKLPEVAEGAGVNITQLYSMNSRNSMNSDDLDRLEVWLIANKHLSPEYASEPDVISPTASLGYREARQERMLAMERAEILKYKWIESQKAGRDLGNEAVRDWIRLYSADFREWYQGEFSDESARRAIDTLFTMAENIADPSLNEEMRAKTLEGDLIKLTAAIQSLLKAPVITTQE